MKRFHTKSPFRQRSWKSPGALAEKRTAVPDPDPCPICHVAVGTRTPDDEVEVWATLPCGHRFGSYCAKRWLGLAEQPACPICRQPMVHICGHPALPIPAPDDGSGGGGDDDDDNDDDNNSDGLREGTKQPGPPLKKMTFASENNVDRGDVVSQPVPDSPTSSNGPVSFTPSLPSFFTPPSASSTASSSSSSSSSNASASSQTTAPRNRLRKRRLSAPLPSMPAPRGPANLDAPCDYCSFSLIKQQIRYSGEHWPGHVASRATTFAMRVLHRGHGHGHGHGHSHSSGSNSSSNSNNNADNAYWERWRQDHGSEFGTWWAMQQPPTEPAREIPSQGWVY